MSELNRRDFVAKAAAVVSLVVLGEELIAQDAPESTTVDIGKPADFAAGSMSDKFAKSDKVLVCRTGDKIIALTAVCTHRGGIIGLKDGVLTCPNHGSQYSADGKFTKGPTKAALARHAISLNDKGNLIVDKTKKFEEAGWNDAAASYTVPAA